MMIPNRKYILNYSWLNDEILDKLFITTNDCINPIGVIYKYLYDSKIRRRDPISSETYLDLDF